MKETHRRCQDWINGLRNELWHTIHTRSSAIPLLKPQDSADEFSQHDATVTRVCSLVQEGALRRACAAGTSVQRCHLVSCVTCVTSTLWFVLVPEPLMSLVAAGALREASRPRENSCNRPGLPWGSQGINQFCARKEVFQLPRSPRERDVVHF